MSEGPSATIRFDVRPIGEPPMPDTWVRNAATEALGVFALCFIGIMAINSPNDLTGLALAQGVAIGVMVAAFGHVSGGHFNPAVTLGLLLGRKIDAPMAGVYWAAQLLGGVMAAVVVALLVSRQAVAIGTPTLADDVNPLVGVVLEMICTFFLVLVVYGTVVDRRAPSSVYPFAIGLTITIGILAIGAYTGGALNPARGFGPALVGGEWGGTVAWLFGPLLGGVAAWALHTFVLMPREEPESIAESGRREEV